MPSPVVSQAGTARKRDRVTGCATTASDASAPETFPVAGTARAERAEATPGSEALVASARTKCYATQLTHQSAENQAPADQLER